MSAEGKQRGNPPTELQTHIQWATSHARHQLPAADGQPEYRRRNVADLVWSPVDAVLTARALSNFVVLAATLGMATLYIRHGGLSELIVNLSGLAVIWGATRKLICVGRSWRGVNPPDHELHR